MRTKITVLDDKGKVVMRKISRTDCVRDKCNPLRINGKLRKLFGRNVARKISRNYEKLFNLFL